MSDDAPPPETEPKPATEPTTPAPATDSPSETLLTQEAVNQIAAKVRAEGASKARQEILDELGVDNLDDAAAVIAATKAAELASMSETERNLAESASELAKAKATEEKTATLYLNVRAAAKLQSAGLEPSIVDRIAPTLGLPADATDEQIASAVDLLKTESPSLFNAQPVPTAPSGVPGSGPATPTSGTGHGDGDEAQQGRNMHETWTKQKL